MSLAQRRMSGFASDRSSSFSGIGKLQDGLGTAQSQATQDPESQSLHLVAGTQL